MIDPALTRDVVVGTTVGATAGWVAMTYAFIGQHFGWPVSGFWYFFVLRVMGFWFAIICLAVSGTITTIPTVLAQLAVSIVAALALGLAGGGLRFGF